MSRGVQRIAATLKMLITFLFLVNFLANFGIFNGSLVEHIIQFGNLGFFK